MPEATDLNSDKAAALRTRAKKVRKTNRHYQNQSAGDGTWSDIFGDVYSGVAVGLGHSRWCILKGIDWTWKAVDRGLHSSVGTGLPRSETGLSPVSSLLGDEAVGAEETRRRMEEGLKVIGVGYGRTGTYSLGMALDELGFPTLHTQHLYENAEIFDMWIDNIIYPSIRDDEVKMGSPDFDVILEAGFTATMDLPMALYFEQIIEQYPNCKFILTVRENSEVWFRSWDIMTSSITQPAQYADALFAHARKLGYYMRWLFSVVNQDKKYLRHPYPLPDQIKASATASYEAHNQRVRDTIPASQLLTYDVRQGWEPLCQFLEIPEIECPSSQDIPFPKSNSARAVQIQSFSSFFIPVMVGFLIMISLLSIAFRRITGMSVVGWCKLEKTRLFEMTLCCRNTKRMKRG